MGKGRKRKGCRTKVETLCGGRETVLSAHVRKTDKATGGRGEELAKGSSGIMSDLSRGLKTQKEETLGDRSCGVANRSDSFFQGAT